MAAFEELLGKTITAISINDDKDEILFITKEGDEYEMYHSQDCCESVTIEDVVGDIDDILNTPVTLASEMSNSGEKDYNSFTYTFYKLATVKGYLDIRWYGTSNGYYSESVSFYKRNSDEYRY